MKIGKIEPMMVIRVDKEKRYIDLSKKKVLVADATSTEIIFKKAKMVHNILRQVVVKLNAKPVEAGVTLLDLYEKFGWDLYDKYDHAYNAFRQIMNDKEEVFKKIKISADEKAFLYEAIARKMAPTALKLRADFEMTCFTSEGIDALKEALITSRTLVNARDPDIVVSFKLIAPPNYRCETVTLKKVEGFALLEEALEEVEKVIKAKGGSYKLTSKPQIVGDSKGNDVDDIPQENDGSEGGGEGGSSNDEDNEEGMGDIDLGEEVEESKEEEEEEKKPKKSKKAKKQQQDSEDEED